MKIVKSISLLQQYLPFTVLKLADIKELEDFHKQIATVLTVYGIETHLKKIIVVVTI